MINAAFARKMCSDELRETLMWCGFAKEYHCKTKEVDSKGKPRYRLDTKLGEILVYGPKSIYMRGKKYTSLNMVRYELGRYVELEI